jgi:hypothetical protein
MKSLSNKENNYSLNSSENYNKELEADITFVISKISELFLDYFKYIIENVKFKKNNFSRFIITRGLDTLIHVFKNVLFYTKNIELTYFHCQKSFYFYVEFVGQISDDEKSFLQLSSRDATTYVYKKTIFEISNELKKNNEQISDYTRLKLGIINDYIDIYKTYLYKLINGDFLNNEHLLIIETIFKKLNEIHNKINIKTFNMLTEKLYHMIEINDTFFNIKLHITKKFIKNPDLFLNFNDKLLERDFDEKLNENPNKFVSWLTS